MNERARQRGVPGWVWGLIGCGAVSIVGLGVLAVVVLPRIVQLATDTVASSDFGRATLREVRADRDVIDAFGGSVEVGSGPTSLSFQGVGGGRTAELVLPLRGPRGVGSVESAGRARGEDWDFSHLAVELPDGAWVDLRAAPAEER